MIKLIIQLELQETITQTIGRQFLYFEYTEKKV